MEGRDKKGKFVKGHETPKEVRKKMSLAKKGKPCEFIKTKFKKGNHPETEFKKGIYQGYGVKKGQISLMKGVKHSEETKEKIRKAHIGKKHKPHSEETKRKIGDKHKGKHFGTGFKKGKANSNWKGGISKLRDRHERTARYKKWRSNVFQRDNWTCQKCGERGKLQVHHIKSWAKYPKLRFEEDNGVTLCVGCHKLTKNYGGKNNGL